LVQQHAETFFAQVQAAAGADLPRFIKDEFEAVLECGRPGRRLPSPALRSIATLAKGGRRAACRHRSRPTPADELAARQQPEVLR
jgi:hypothetical protein